MSKEVHLHIERQGSSKIVLFMTAEGVTQALDAYSKRGVLKAAKDCVRVEQALTFAGIMVTVTAEEEFLEWLDLMGVTF